MATNPLDFIVDFTFKIIFGFVLGFVGIFIITWGLGNAGYGFVWAISGRGTWVGFSIEQTSYLLNQAFLFMQDWFPYAWYIFQWILWLFIGSWSGLFPMPTAPWM